MKRIFSLAVCLLLVAVSLSGCGRELYKAGALEIAIPDNYIDLSQADYAKDADFLFGRDTLIVMGIAEKKAGLKEMTLAEYTDLLISGNELETARTLGPNGYRFAYRATVGEDTYTYYTGTFEAGDHFWTVQCYCPTGDFAKHSQQMEEILASVKTDVLFRHE